MRHIEKSVFGYPYLAREAKAIFLFSFDAVRDAPFVYGFPF
jgi:hypothetical protein